MMDPKLQSHYHCEQMQTAVEDKCTGSALLNAQNYLMRVELALPKHPNIFMQGTPTAHEQH